MKNVLLIGAGTMGRTHAEAYTAMKEVSLRGIVDSDAAAADKAAERFGIRAFGSYEEAMMELDAVDVVDICLPTYLHREYVLKAADDGKHIICEKPLAGSLKDAREMIDYCKDKKTKLFVGHVVRFFPEYVQARQVMEQKGLGDIAVVKASRTSSFPRAWDNWYADASKSGGLLLDLSIHDFDYLRWCFGEVERVFAKAYAPESPEGGGYALTTLTFRSGVIAHVEGSWSHQKFTTSFEIAGTEGIIDFNSANDNPILSFRKAPDKPLEGAAVPESPLLEAPYYRELAHFLSCMETGEEPIVTAEDAYQALAISLAAIESSRSGMPVALA
ncbi:Gfo/Idh/MocA family protein [Paenibacillus rhizophilus]|uniref:Gfo/Idh/MocA family oxidoreductase n=1 Tax=Paenibacillus rhizophilus TaxID=1850366 RepID=A0A3N9P8G2_9BACL|nr:Gfo/Idh/MocA family oxidoreductase [Paenibacillus rhizophilus]RQW12508.1 gfo/Idh/MocA family oxidoreductase [Paenibacillus rhizophilus]